MAVQRTLHGDSACELWEVKTKTEFWYTAAFGKSVEHNSAESCLVYHPSFFQHSQKYTPYA